MQNKIIVFIVLCFTAMQLMAQSDIKKRVYWVHGLGGSPAKWNVYEPYFSKQRPTIDATRPGYDSGKGLVNGGDVVAPQMPYFGTIGANDEADIAKDAIAIGHSMGGLVTRDVARDWRNGKNKPRFQGFVCIGSSHSGAPIGNSVQNGNVAKMIHKGIGKLLAGPALAAVSGLGALAGAVGAIGAGGAAVLASATTGAVGGGIVGGAGTAFVLWGKGLTPSAIQGLLDVQTQASGSLNLRVGGPEVVQLNAAAPPPMPKVAIKGIEEEPIVWRIANQVTDDPANSPVNTYTDQPFVDNIHQSQNIYVAVGVLYTVLGTVALVTLNFPSAALCYVTAAAFFIGADWFDQANDEWHAIIGAGNFTQTVCYQTGNMVSICLDPDPQVQAGCEQMCPPDKDGCLVPEEICYQQLIFMESDGVVPLNSQDALPDKLPWTRTAMGAGHQEERNHPQMTKFLEEVFDGDPNKVFIRN